MGIRVIARIRPQQKHELDKDTIISISNTNSAAVVKVPNPKNGSELYSFQFSGVYDQHATQQDIFDNEISPTIKQLFSGFDVTIFAYGSTGTGKTHTMRGAKSLADRGVIPRLLSGVYRRARKMMKDSDGATSVRIALAYYEIYNDKVFDLFEPSEKRSATGLPIRDNAGKTVVVGLTERPCESLKEFEQLYDEANVNRSTGATKLNASSSRSHAVLRLTLTISSGDELRTCIASAIDLAGSEDNRRTENGKERMVESASINKSLFTLAKCVEAIGRGDERIPYRESKMTRILSLGQTKGITVMILNLAPIRSCHLDTLSSLHFANRTKKIEVREIENEPVFKGCTRAVPSFVGSTIQRQPLRPLASTVHNAGMAAALVTKKVDKQSKTFAVFSDRSRPSNGQLRSRLAPQTHRSPLKRSSDLFSSSASRPAKRRTQFKKMDTSQPNMSQQAMEDMIERKVTDMLAARALDQPSIAPQPEISEDVRRRLADLEKKIEGKDDGREQGLSFLLMAKQHAVRGEDASALRMYTLAKDFFPQHQKLEFKIEKLQAKMILKQDAVEIDRQEITPQGSKPNKFLLKKPSQRCMDENDPDYEPESRTGQRHDRINSPPIDWESGQEQTPRSQRLLQVVNSRDVSRIRQLKGVGAKKAKAILEAFATQEEPGRLVRDLRELSHLKGVGAKAVENMREAL